MSFFTAPAVSRCGARNVMGFKVLAQLGEGAGSVLYSVIDPASGRAYALKHVRPTSDRELRFVEQLENEFHVGRKVNHEGLRRAVDLKVHRTLLRKIDEAALVLELIDGQPLDQRLPESMTALVSTFIHIAEALHGLHAGGFIHCDLKPNNILVLPGGGVKVIDLGQACPNGAVKQRIQGTPDYIAPEQVRREPVSPRTDVYNLGATMYWALAGQSLPTLYTAGRAANSFLLEQSIPSPHNVNVRVPEPLSNLVMECVHTKPAKRPASMRELIRRLEIIQHVLKRCRAGAAGHPVAV